MRMVVAGVLLALVVLVDPNAILQATPTPVGTSYCSGRTQVISVSIAEYTVDGVYYRYYFSPETKKGILVALRERRLVFGRVHGKKFETFEALTPEQATKRYGTACSFLAAPEVYL